MGISMASFLVVQKVFLDQQKVTSDTYNAYEQNITFIAIKDILNSKENCTETLKGLDARGIETNYFQELKLGTPFTKAISTRVLGENGGEGTVVQVKGNLIEVKVEKGVFLRKEKIRSEDEQFDNKGIDIVATRNSQPDSHPARLQNPEGKVKLDFAEASFDSKTLGLSPLRLVKIALSSTPGDFSRTPRTQYASNFLNFTFDRGPLYRGSRLINRQVYINMTLEKGKDKKKSIPLVEACSARSLIPPAPNRKYTVGDWTTEIPFYEGSGNSICGMVGMKCSHVTQEYTYVGRVTTVGFKPECIHLPTTGNLINDTEKEWFKRKGSYNESESIERPYPYISLNHYNVCFAQNYDHYPTLLNCDKPYNIEKKFTSYYESLKEEEWPEIVCSRTKMVAHCIGDKFKLMINFESLLKSRRLL